MIKSVVSGEEKCGGGFDAPGGCCPRRVGDSGVEHLLAVPELVLRCFPVMLKIIPHKIIFPFLTLVRENRSLDAMKRELQLLSVPGLLCMIEQPLCTIPGLADVADLLRDSICQDIQARASGNGPGFLRHQRFEGTP